MKHLFGGRSDIVDISAGYFCTIARTRDGELLAFDNIVRNHQKVVCIGAFDYNIVVTSETNEKNGTIGKVYTANSENKDITGSFRIDDFNSKVGFSGQRDCCVLYLYRDEEKLSKHFVLMDRLIKRDFEPLSDIVIRVIDTIY